MIKPTVAQYCYNAISRDLEREAHACFRELGIRCYHYNPLAGGLLTGKYDSIEDDREEGRFGKKSPISGAMYSARYWKAEIFKAVDLIKTACASAEIKFKILSSAT